MHAACTRVRPSRPNKMAALHWRLFTTVKSRKQDNGYVPVGKETHSNCAILYFVDQSNGRSTKTYCFCRMLIQQHAFSVDHTSHLFLIDVCVHLSSCHQRLEVHFAQLSRQTVNSDTMDTTVPNVRVGRNGPANCPHARAMYTHAGSYL